MKYFSAILFLTVVACNSSRHAGAVTSANILPENISLNGKLFSSLFQQRAAEYRALCLQAYNAARMCIDSHAAQTQKPKALITDIDETILDNSPFAVHQALKGIEYVAADWYDWTSRSAADTMPGAAALLKYAASKGLEIFYITNREEKERAGTLKNLQRFNLPNADDRHLLLRQTTSSKEPRRQQVMQDYEVVVLMGDNLADLSALFDKKTEEERGQNADALAAEFGKQLIVLPNVNYGDWESSLYKYNYKLTQAGKDSVMKRVLRSY